MNSKMTVVAAVAAAAVGTGAVAMTASGDPVAATTIDLKATPTGGAPVNVGPKTLSPGDEFLEHGVLSDTSRQSVGRFQMITQFVNGSARRGNEQSSFTLYLKGGQLAVTGGHATTSRFTLPVIGGTGTYAGAAGTLSVMPGSRETENLHIVLRANP